MALDTSKFKDIFLAEADDQAETLSRLLLLLEQDSAHPEYFEQLMRAAHTLKGSSATMGYAPLASLAHALEDVFRALERGEVAITPEVITTLLSGVDAVVESLRALKEDAQLPALSDSATVVRELLSHSQATAVLPKLPPKVTPEQLIVAPDVVKVGTEKLDALMGIFEELLMLRLKLDVMIEPANEFLRTVSDAGLKQRLFFIHEFHSLFAQMSRLLAENQEALLAIRLVTLDQIFGQYPRMVRDLAVREGKRVEFIVHGGDVALDRTVIDGLGGALSHLLRNAVDHGIADRGTITLSARREKGRAKVIVEDDGAGIDYDRVRRVAIERGVETKERVDAMKNAAVAELLFHPNMTTTDVVTDVSGRGVGVSAVYAFARDVGGRLDVESPIPELGRGTRFTLDLPVSLATIRVLLVESSGHTFAVPFENIDRTHEYTPGDVRGVAHQETLVVDGALLPLLRLKDVLGLAFSGMSQGGGGKSLAVILHTRTSRIALEIDSCAGEQDLLIKSLPPVLRDVKGFSGSALLPDGRTILLLDVQGLLAHALGDILERTNEHAYAL